MTNLTTPPAVKGTWPTLHDAIHKAGRSGDVSELRSLLSSEPIDVTSDNHRWRNATVLHTAAFTNIEIVDFLLDNGADRIINARCGPGEDGRWAGHTALHVAAKRGSMATAITARLIRAGADYDIHAAAAFGDCERMIELLDSDSSNLSATDAYQSTPLHWAAHQGQLEAVQLLLDHSADVNVGNDFGETPLLTCSVFQENQQSEIDDRLAIANLLLESGASTDAATLAAYGNAKSLQSFVMYNPESVKLTNCHGTTPLHWAARNARIPAAKLLLEHRAYVNALDANGCSPLWYAAYWAKDAKMTQVLCRNGADTEIKNRWGKTIHEYDIGWECNTVVLRFQPS